MRIADLQVVAPTATGIFERALNLGGRHAASSRADDVATRHLVVARIEPIGQAIIAAFHARPEEMLSMAEYAIADDQFHLAWRLNTAAREVTSATNAKVAEAAEVAVALTDEYFRQHYTQLLHETLGAGESLEEPPRSPEAEGEDKSDRGEGNVEAPAR